MSPSGRLQAASGTANTGEHSLKDARAPTQSRGQKRVDEILDAAEELIAEVGIEAMTTNAIAERAGSSIGSLYHFFPSKDAIIQALAHRFTLVGIEINHGAMSPQTLHEPLDKLFERIVMGQAALIHARPAYNAVYDACCDMPPGPNGPPDMREMIVGHISGFLAARYPDMPKQDREISARLAVTVVNKVLREASRMPRATGTRLLRELQLMMVRYAEPMEAQYGKAAGAAGRRDAAPHTRGHARGHTRGHNQ